MFRRAALTHVVTLLTSASLMAQNTAAPGSHNVNIDQVGSPVVSTTPPPPPQPPALPRLNILVTAFKPFQRSETNMAQMVAQSIEEIFRTDRRFSQVELSRLDLNVVYTSSSEDLIRAIKSGPQPDVILSLGQGQFSKVVIETGADKGDSSIRDENGRNRYESNFPALPREVGFNFPVQDLYCSLNSSERRKVEISFKGGNFVCNDLSYYMANYVKPKSEVERLFQQYNTQATSQINSQKAQISQKMEADLAADKAEFDRIRAEEAPAYAAYLQQLEAVRARNAVKRQQADEIYREQLRQYEAELERIRSANFGVVVHTGTPAQALPSGQTYGPPANSGYGPQSNSGWTSPQTGNQNDNRAPVRPQPDYSQLEFEPIFSSKAVDRSQSIRGRAQSELNGLDNQLRQILAKTSELQDLLGTNTPTKFVFMHVPASDGVIYEPKYNLLNASCVGRQNTQLPANWYHESEATQKMDMNLSQLRARARGFIDQTLRTPDGNKKTWPLDTCTLSSGTQLQNRFDYGKNRYVQVEVALPPTGILVYQLQEYAQRAEIRELNEARGYAQTISEMLYGALIRSNVQRPSEFPLPTFHNNKSISRADAQLNETIDWLKKLGEGYYVTNTVPPVGSATVGTNTQTFVPPQMNASESECYQYVVRQIKGAARADRSGSGSRF